MAADQREAFIRAYIDEVFNGHRLDAWQSTGWRSDIALAGNGDDPRVPAGRALRSRHSRTYLADAKLDTKPFVWTADPRGLLSERRSGASRVSVLSASMTPTSNGLARALSRTAPRGSQTSRAGLLSVGLRLTY
jgi:hypothetical protein